MASVNKWIGIGNLGKDPETRFAPSGDAICNITMACTDSYKDKSTGEKKEITEWVRVVFFGKLAEIAGQYLKKGSQIYVEGSLRTRKWQDKDGQDRYTTEIRADELKMLGGRQDGSSQSDVQSRSQGGGQPRQQDGGQQGQPAPAKSGGSGFGDFDDQDIPF